MTQRRRRGLTRRELIQGSRPADWPCPRPASRARRWRPPVRPPPVRPPPVWPRPTARPPPPMGHDRRRRRRLRGLDRLAPAQSGPARAAARRVRSRQRARLVRRRVAHDAHDLRRGRRLHAHGVGLAARTGAGCRRAPGLPIFHADRRADVLRQARAVRRPEHRGAPRLRPAPRRARPRASCSGAIRRSRGTASRSGLFEPELGALMARRAVQTLVQEFVAAGGEYRLAAVLPPGDGADARRPAHDAPARRCAPSATSSPAVPGCRSSSRRCSAARIFPTRQEVLLLRAARTATSASRRAHLPGWADFNDGDIYYGFPDLESRGFKIAHDAHGDALRPRHRRPAGRARPAWPTSRALPRAALPGARRAAARGVARLPVREQLERRPPDRPPPALAERAPRRRRLRPRLQARPRRRPLRRGPADRPAGAAGAALQPGEQGRRPAPRGALTTRRPGRRRLDKAVTPP